MSAQPFRMPAPGASAEEWAAFLRHQLQGAVALLKQREATEEAIAAKYQKRFEGEMAQMRNNEKLRTHRMRELEAELGADARRYRKLRKHLVQVWAIGIGATGEALDKLLDEKLPNLKETRQ